MSRHQSTEVLVVGAGPVGMLSALVLARSGIGVTLVDREQRPATHSYACGLHPRSLGLFDRLGLLPEIQQAARRLDRVAFHSARGREAEIRFAALPVEFPFVLVLPQSALESILAKSLAQWGCQVLWNHRLSTVQARPGEVVAEVDELVGTAMGYIVPHWEWVVRRTLDITASFVIGADGHHSLVRRLVGIEHQQLADPELYVVYEFESASPVADELCVVLDQGARSVLWPLTHGRCRWSFQLTDVQELGDFSDKDRSLGWAESTTHAERTFERLKARLKARAPWFGAGIRKVDWAVDIQFQHRLAREFGRQRCWLAGDAAHQTSPAGIQSMNAGLIEAEDLAGRLVQILRQNAPLEVLQRYDRTHHEAWQQLQGATGAPQPGPDTRPWVKENAGQLVSSIPATGNDLTGLLAQLGLKLP